MSKHKRTVWDDLVELGREVIEKIDQLLNPDHKRKPARVPVPVYDQPPRQEPNDNPYNHMR